MDLWLKVYLGFANLNVVLSILGMLSVMFSRKRKLNIKDIKTTIFLVITGPIGTVIIIISSIVVLSDIITDKYEERKKKRKIDFS